MNANRIPDIIIGRLPVYLRALQQLSEKGIMTTSSQELGEIIGISAAQIRRISLNSANSGNRAQVIPSRS
jgi:redox-sensing transcriptional repressor